MKYSNPARRLHTILSAGNTITGNDPCKSAWGTLLEVAPASPELLRKLAKVMMLPEQIMEIVEREFPARLEIQKHWHSNVRGGFENQNLSSTWSTFSNYIAESSVDFLAMTSDLIEEKTSNDDITEDDLNTIKSRFLKVSEEIINGQLSPHLKIMMVRLIAKIIAAIDDYKISGSADILSAIDMALGRAVYDVEYRSALSDTDEGVSFREVMGAAANMVTVVSGVQQLSASFMKLLGNN